MRQPDVAGLLAPGAIVDLPGGELAEMARALVRQGLADVTERTFVRCCNPADPDIAYAVDRACRGRVYLSGDDDDPVWCPRCDRRLDVGSKQHLQSLILQPNLQAVRGRIERMLADLGVPVREHPDGVFRVEGESGDVAVVLLDVCDARVGSGLVEQGAVAVAADHGRFRWRLPRGRPPLDAAELVLCSAEGLLVAVRRGLSGVPAVVLVPPRPDDSGAAAARFSLPPGAGWSDVTIYYVDGATVGIAVPGSRPLHASAVELGMAKQNSRTPSKRFALLLHLCRHRGRTDWKRARSSDEEPIAFDNFTAFRMQAGPLRRDLQRLFGLPGDPFTSFGERKELAVAFRALPEAPSEADYLEKRVG
jgi:hypothetical protein